MDTEVDMATIRLLLRTLRDPVLEPYAVLPGGKTLAETAHNHIVYKVYSKGGATKPCQ